MSDNFVPYSVFNDAIKSIRDDFDKHRSEVIKDIAVLGTTVKMQPDIITSRLEQVIATKNQGIMKWLIGIVVTIIIGITGLAATLSSLQ